MQRWDAGTGGKLCTWLQNGQSNYYWHSGEKTLYLCNYRLWKRSGSGILVRRLPSDPPELHAFLDGIEGTVRGLTQSRDRRTGLITEYHDTRFVNAVNFQSVCEYNGQDASDFQPFWPENSPVIDERDEMRRRGWTTFAITGTIDDTPIRGYGCLPFFTDHMQEHPAWLIIEAAGQNLLMDTPQGARRSGRSYPSGSFFAGLLRPWMGIHTIDMIRRDAAGLEIPFETMTGEDYTSEATVRIQRQDRGVSSQLEYQIDMDDDLIRQIVIEKTDAHGNRRQGVLVFQYAQSLTDEAINASQSPSLVPGSSRLHDPPGLQWLFDLAGDAL